MVPALALVGIVWAGVSGARPDEGVAIVPATAAVAAPGVDIAAPGVDVAAPTLATAVRPPDLRFPAQVLGLEVHRLDEIRLQRLGRDTPIAVAGWYLTTGIDDCPPLAAMYRQAALPEIRSGVSEWAFCRRSGLLYASRPDLEERVPGDTLEDDRSVNGGLEAVFVTLVIGVIAPRQLEVIGGDSTQVVFVGRFVASGEGCEVAVRCAHELVVDHLAWANSL